MNKHSRKLLSSPYIVWITAFIILPLFMVIYYGFTTENGTITLSNFGAIFRLVHLKALWLSLELSLISTAICLLLAYPLAAILSNLSLKSSHLIAFLFILPMWMNFLLRTLAWQTLLDKNGVINNMLNTLNMPSLNIINTPIAIVLGMVYNYFPFMVLPIYNNLIKIDKDIINAARDLGAGECQTFCRITLPLSIPGIVSGITMVFVPALTTFAISDILGGAKVQLIGNIIEQEFITANNWNTGSGLSLVLMIFIIVSMLLMNKYEKEPEGNTIW